MTAARTVLQTGEYDFAPFLQLEPDVLDDLERSSRTGAIVLGPGVGVEMLMFNQADPSQEVDGERSHAGTRHPFLADARVREALVLAMDRSALAARIFGRTADATPNILTAPRRLGSATTRLDYDVDRANAILDAAGFVRGADGIRHTPDGRRLQMLYTTTVSAQRQKIQAVIKSAWEKVGIETEIRAVAPSSFFATADNPEAAVRFPADVQMLLVSYSSPFPAAYMRRYYAADPARDWAQRSNGWTGGNSLKWRDPTYNQVYDQVMVARDVEKGQVLWRRLNDILVQSHAVVPLVERKFVSAVRHGLVGPDPGAFDLETWNIGTWTSE